MGRLLTILIALSLLTLALSNGAAPKDGIAHQSLRRTDPHEGCDHPPADNANGTLNI